MRLVWLYFCTSYKSINVAQDIIYDIRLQERKRATIFLCFFLREMLKTGKVYYIYIYFVYLFVLRMLYLDLKKRIFSY